MNFTKTIINSIKIWVNRQLNDLKSKFYEDLETKIDKDSETDPTVPAWAKAATKPTYTANEVGALPDTTVIPSKISNLINDSGFVTEAYMQEHAQPKGDYALTSEIPSIDGLASEEYVDEEIVALIDTTLSVEGKAADAKATGNMGKELAAQHELLVSRVNNIIANGNSTEENSELVDIRVGYDGSVYESAGEAVRNQFTELGLVAKANGWVKVQNTFYESEGDVTNQINPNNRWFFHDTISECTVGSIKLYIQPTTVDSTVTVELWTLADGKLTKSKEAVVSVPTTLAAGYVETTLNWNVGAEAMISVLPAHYSVVCIGSSGTMYKGSTTDETIAVSDLVAFIAGGFLGNIKTYTYELRSEAQEGILYVGSKQKYETIQSAVDAAYNGDTILVYPGVYQEQVNALGKEVHIIGMNKNSCILIDSSANYYTPPLWMNIGSIENMTVIEDAADPDPNTPEGYLNWAYCIHVDGSTTAIGKQMRISNCILKNANRACLGMGTFANYSIVVENCDIYSGKHADNQPDRGAIYCHNSMDVAENQRVRFYNNRIECGGALTLCLLNTFQESGDFTAEFINNMCWSAENGKTDESVQLYLDSYMKLAESSYGNNIACLNAQ